MKKITESDLVKVSMVDDFFSIKAILYIDLIEVPKAADYLLALACHEAVHHL